MAIGGRILPHYPFPARSVPWRFLSLALELHRGDSLSTLVHSFGTGGIFLGVPVVAPLCSCGVTCNTPSGEKKTCLEMGGAGEADARLAFGKSARLGRLLVVVNHRVLPSSPMVGRVSGSSSARTRV